MINLFDFNIFNILTFEIEEEVPSFFSRRMIRKEEGNHAISADDQFIHAYGFARRYADINIATSESLQFLFLEATTFENKIML